jgi:hypothetical protein
VYLSRNMSDGLSTPQLALGHCETVNFDAETDGLSTPQAALKRCRTATSDAEADDKKKVLESVERLLQERRLTPAVLLAVFESMLAGPYLPIPRSSDARGLAVEHHVSMDALGKTVNSTHDRVREDWRNSEWDTQRQANYMVLAPDACRFCCVAKTECTQPQLHFNQELDFKWAGEVVPDGCAICGVVKTECTQKELHFGKKGESPPESRCPGCHVGFGNSYGAPREL